MAGPVAAAGGDHPGRAAGPGGQHPVGMQAVAAQVHQRAAGQLQRPARVVVGGGRDDHVDLDAAQLAQLARGQ
jgi:hypothetical protein